MFVGEVINSLITLLLGVVCAAFGLYCLISKKVKKENKKKGIIPLVTGIFMILGSCFFVL